MRGLLRFTKAAPPLRRGGLAFASIGTPLVVSAKQLTAGGLAQLIADPTVRIEAGQDDGTFEPAPEFVNVGVGQLQMLIDAAPDVEVPSEGTLDPVADELDRMVAKLRAAGFRTVDDVLSHSAAMDALLANHELGSIDALGEALTRHALDAAALGNAGFASVGEALEKLVTVENELKDANVEGDDLAKKVTALEAEVAGLKAKPADDGKPAKAKTPPASK